MNGIVHCAHLCLSLLLSFMRSLHVMILIVTQSPAGRTDHSMSVPSIVDGHLGSFIGGFHG
jgi:hypothetical protein